MYIYICIYILEYTMIYNINLILLINTRVYKYFKIYFY